MMKQCSVLMIANAEEQVKNAEIKSCNHVLSGKIANFSSGNISTFIIL